MLFAIAAAGFYKFVVHNVKEVELLLMHNRRYTAEIAHNVSTQKRKAIVERASEVRPSLAQSLRVHACRWRCTALPVQVPGITPEGMHAATHALKRVFLNCPCICVARRVGKHAAWGLASGARSLCLTDY